MVVEIHCFMYKIHNVDFRGWAGKPFFTGQGGAGSVRPKIYGAGKGSKSAGLGSWELTAHNS